MTSSFHFQTVWSWRRHLHVSYVGEFSSAYSGDGTSRFITGPCTWESRSMGVFGAGNSSVGSTPPDDTRRFVLVKYWRVKMRIMIMLTSWSGLSSRKFIDSCEIGFRIYSLSMTGIYVCSVRMIWLFVDLVRLRIRNTVAFIWLYY